MEKFWHRFQVSHHKAPANLHPTEIESRPMDYFLLIENVGFDNVDGRNPKQPPGMVLKPLQIVG